MPKEKHHTISVGVSLGTGVVILLLDGKELAMSPEIADNIAKDLKRMAKEVRKAFPFPSDTAKTGA